MKHGNLVRFLCIICMIVGGGLWSFAFFKSVSTQTAMNQYWDDIQIQIQRTKIKSYDGIELSAFIMRTTPIYEYPNGSLPVVIHMNGINSQKEDHFDYTINLAKLGFLTVVVECRGHGESGGRISLYGQEPGDIPKVIDHIRDHYPEANTTHVAVSGFSYGAGNMLRAQTLDDRIYCEVLFHPLSDLHSFLLDYQLPVLVGNSWFTPIQYGNYTGDKIEGRNASSWVNSDNTENLLLIQGTADDTVYPEDTTNIFNLLNGDSREDIQIVYRPGLGHGENERNPISQKYALTWLKYYFWNQSINRDNLNIEINYIERFEYQSPSIMDISNFVWGGVIMCIIGVWIFFRFRLKEEAETKVQFSFSNKNEPNESKSQDQLLFRYFLALSTTSLITGFVSMRIDPNLIWSLFIIIPLVSAGIFIILIPGISKSLQKACQRPFIIKQIRLFVEAIFFIVPLIIGCAIYDSIMIRTYQRPIWPWIPLLFVAIILIPFIFASLYLPFRVILDQYPKKSKWKGLFLLPLWIGSMYIYTIFVPMPSIDGISFSVWIIPAIIGLLFFMLGPLFRVMHAVWGKILPIFLLIAVIACIYLLDNAYNLLI